MAHSKVCHVGLINTNDNVSILDDINCQCKVLKHCIGSNYARIVNVKMLVIKISEVIIK